MNHPIILLDRDNKAKLEPAFFSYFIELLGEKIDFSFKSASYNSYKVA